MWRGDITTSIPPELNMQSGACAWSGRGLLTSLPRGKIAIGFAREH